VNTDCCFVTVLNKELTGDTQKDQRIILKLILEKYDLIMRS
jgi:hypothetical protein